MMPRGSEVSMWMPPSVPFQVRVKPRMEQSSFRGYTSCPLSFKSPLGR